MPRKHSPAQIVSFLSRTGHLQRPFGNPQDLPADLSKLTLQDTCVREAIRSHQSLDDNYELFAMAVHGRSLVADGDIGPATELVIDLPRCGEPDYPELGDVAAAVGKGNWPRCHGVGDFHAVSVKLTNSPPSFLAPLWDQVKERVTQAYAEIGLLIHWDGRAPVNIDFSFVGSSAGWIGLAIVGNGQSCNDRIWCRYLATYRGGSTDEAIITQWTTLVKHELGHNTGMSHSRGGVMNPSIVNGLPVSWKGDPSEGLLTSRFGGEAVPRGPGSDQPQLVLARKFPDGRYEDITVIRQGGGGGSWPV